MTAIVLKQKNALVTEPKSYDAQRKEIDNKFSVGLAYNGNVECVGYTL